MNNSIKFLIDKKNTGKRLDVFLSNKITSCTRSYIKSLIKMELVKINKSITITPSLKLKFKDQVLIKLIDKKVLNVEPWNVKLDILHEDRDLIIVNKPKGMVVHPGSGNTNRTLVNALKSKFENNLSTINGNLRPGIVHRIDKNTSGLLVIAKNNSAHSNLGKQFSKHTIKRKYICLVWGVIRPLNGKIQTMISRDKKNRQLMAVSENSGKKAITNYKTLKVFYSKDVPKISLIECILETGRTHQIRVHLKYKGASIIGDKQYGKNNLRFKKINKDFLKQLSDIEGQVLHAKTLEFIHPTHNKLVQFDSKLPPDFNKMLDFLSNLKT